MPVGIHRNGKFTKAVATLEKSLNAGKGESDAFDLFFLAMCHHRLGDAARAKERYDQVGRWFQERRSQLSAEWVQELTAFQTEAEAVLAQPAGMRP